MHLCISNAGFNLHNTDVGQVAWVPWIVISTLVPWHDKILPWHKPFPAMMARIKAGSFVDRLQLYINEYGGCNEKMIAITSDPVE